MREGTAPITVNRLDYREPDYWIRSVDLTFDLDLAKTIVASKLEIERNAFAIMACNHPAALRNLSDD